MKKIFLMLTAGVLAFSACKKDEDDKSSGGGSSDKFTATQVTGASDSTIQVTGVLSDDYTLTNDVIWIISGKLVVGDGAELTVDAGTIIKGAAGEGSLASALIVAQGGEIAINGTSANPVVMTSITDNIALGEKFGTNLSESNVGLWGGLIILGKAEGSFSGDAATELIEGIPSNESYAVYGGSDNTDNSGTITYLSIRHGGSLIGDGNEINGLTLGGVGSGTTISYVEIVANKDDGVEFFGGAVDVDHLLTWNCQDDAIDTDQEWIGTLDNFLVIAGNGGSAFELDAPEGTASSPAVRNTITNGSVDATGFGNDDNGLIDFDATTNTNLSNVYFYNLEAGQNSADINGSTTGSVTGIEVESFPVSETNTTMFDGITVSTVGASNTVGATTSEFSWTFASNEIAF